MMTTIRMMPVDIVRKAAPLLRFSFHSHHSPSILRISVDSFVSPSPHPLPVLRWKGLSNVSGETDTANSMREYSLDGTRITSLVHSVWKEVILPGDIAIDATCGNGNDTLALAKLVFADGGQGLIYAFDLQQIALKNTSALLDQELNENDRNRVHLFQMCHSKMGEVVNSENSVSVVAFNLGYLPKGDKSVITEIRSTVQALESAISLVRPKGVITIVSYVGHQGGREEYEAVRCLASNLPTTHWVCSQREWLNRPLCPRLIVLFKKGETNVSKI